MYTKKIFKILVLGLLASGCSDVAEKFRNQYNPSRAVVDQGGSNVISTGNACALDDPQNPKTPGQNFRRKNTY